MSKLLKYRRSVTKREGKKISVNDAQVAEIFHILNEDTEGLFYELIKGGVFVPGSSPDARDSNPYMDALKACVKHL